MVKPPIQSQVFCLIFIRWGIMKRDFTDMFVCHKKGMKLSNGNEYLLSIFSLTKLTLVMCFRYGPCEPGGAGRREASGSEGQEEREEGETLHWHRSARWRGKKETTLQQTWPRACRVSGPRFLLNRPKQRFALLSTAAGFGEQISSFLQKCEY